MPVGVVHGLEPVEVDEEDPDLLGVLAEALVEQLVKCTAVRKIGERVEVGEQPQLGLGPVALGDVVQGGDDGVDPAPASRREVGLDDRRPTVIAVGIEVEGDRRLTGGGEATLDRLGYVLPLLGGGDRRQAVVLEQRQVITAESPRAASLAK